MLSFAIRLKRRQNRSRNWITYSGFHKVIQLHILSNFGEVKVQEYVVVCTII